MIRASHVLLLMRLVLASFFFAAVTRTVADADLWGHVVFGRDIVQLGAIPSRDHYSFTSDVPWINHEWLAEVVSYLSYDAAGPAGLVAVKSALVLATLAVVFVSLRPISADVVVHDLLVFVAIAGIYVRAITFRPQVFSLVLFAVLLLLLVNVERGHRKALVAVPMVFVLWANLHGGWIVGLAALGIWAIWTFVHADRYSVSRPAIAAVAVAACAATLVNPYGIGLWRFLWSTVGLSRDIADWQPLWKLPAVVLVPWLVTLVLAVRTTIVEWRRINPAHLGIVLMCMIGSIRVSRLDAFFVLSVIVLLGTAIRSAIRRDRQQEMRTNDMRAGRLSIAATLLVCGVLVIITSSANVRCITIEEDWAPEAEAAAFVHSQRLRGRMLTFFDWGEYAIWHFAPDIQVSIDGRRETVYSDQMISSHFALYGDRPGALDLVNQIRPEYVWLPSWLPVVNTLREAGWAQLFAGPRSVILARQSASVAKPAPESPIRRRCFPGP